MTSAGEFDQFTAQGFVEDLDALLAVLFFVVGDEHDDAADALANGLVDGILVVRIASDLVGIRNLPGSDKDQRVDFLFGVAKPSHEECPTTGVADQNGRLVDGILLELFFEFLVHWRPRLGQKWNLCGDTSSIQLTSNPGNPVFGIRALT